MLERPPILALDLATRTGWAFLPAGADRPESGAVQLIPASCSDPGRRVVALEAWLWPRLKPLAAGQGVLVYETPGLVQNRAAPFRVGCHLESAVLRLAQAWGVATILTATAPQLKKHATGLGNVNKDAVVAAMRVRWALRELEDDNAADALALLSYALESLAAGGAGAAPRDELEDETRDLFPTPESA